MGELSNDLRRERRAFRSTLAEVGPDAPTGCGVWTAADLAIHMVTGELGGAVPNAPFRWLVGHGVRLDWMAPLSERALASWRRRRDFEWTLRRLDRPPPWLHCRGVVAAVSLLEIWAHHEDLLVANDLGPCRTGVDLTPVVAVLIRYQRALLDSHDVRIGSEGRVWHEPKATMPRATVDGSLDDIARWLAGRGNVGALAVEGDPDGTAALALARPHL